MGICGSSLTEEQKLSKRIDSMAANDHNEQKRKIKLLLLGAGESGKSTIFKQMKILYGVGFSQVDLEATVPIIFANILSSMQSLCKATDDLAIPVTATDEKTFIMEQKVDTTAVEGKVAECVETLWKDEGIQSAYEQRAKFQLNDSAAYYFNKLDVISQPGYVATVDDLLKSRVRTSGIVEEAYCIDGVDFIMYDVGGQRNERKKWIHCFDDVTAVIFVASLSEYDQSLYEDSDVNRMDEAITLFADIANSRWFKHTSMILFLNKRDLFEEKIRKVDIRSDGSDGFTPRFLDYHGGKCTCSLEEECTCGAQVTAKEYILSQFTSKYTEPGKQIYSHVTCATDSENVKVVFDACREIILRENLAGSGFME